MEKFRVQVRPEGPCWPQVGQRTSCAACCVRVGPTLEARGKLGHLLVMDPVWSRRANLPSRYSHSRRPGLVAGDSGLAASQSGA